MLQHQEEHALWEAILTSPSHAIKLDNELLSPNYPSPHDITTIAIFHSAEALNLSFIDLVQIDLRCQLHETRCNEGGDIKAHLGELLQLHKLLASMGASLDDRDFAAIIMGSLPESYRPILSSMNAAAHVLSKVLSPYDIMSAISEEYEHRMIANPTTSKKGRNTALTAGTKPDRSKSWNGGGDSNVTCYNRNNVGHVKANCWSKGRGKEGQRPQ
jgi:hypothetical protein